MFSGTYVTVRRRHDPMMLINGKFVHESCGTFFALEGAEKQFTLIQGLPWEGGETFDDYC